MKPWFQFKNAAGDPTAVEIHIIDVIGGWFDDMVNRFYNEEITVTARAFVEQLAALPESVRAIHVHINSPGGDVQAGVNIANALRDQQVSKGRTVETFVDGMAASIASVIAMAGSKVHMGDNALMMIHNPWSVSVGTAAEMRKTADVLDVMRGQIVATYRWHSELEPAALEALMDAETWMDADEALSHGLATDKREGLKAAAALNASAIGRLSVPDRFRARVDALLAPKAEDPAPAPEPAPVADPEPAPAPTPAPEPEPAPESAPADPAAVLALCRQHGMLDLAEGLVTTKAALPAVQARIDEEKRTRAAAQKRSDDVTALCSKARLPELAAAYITGGMALEAVKAQLTIITAKVAGQDIDGSLRPDHGGKPKARIDVSKVYADLNQKH